MKSLTILVLRWGKSATYLALIVLILFSGLGMSGQTKTDKVGDMSHYADGYHGGFIGLMPDYQTTLEPKKIRTPVHGSNDI